MTKKVGLLFYDTAPTKKERSTNNCTLLKFIKFSAVTFLGMLMLKIVKVKKRKKFFSYFVKICPHSIAIHFTPYLR